MAINPFMYTTPLSPVRAMGSSPYQGANYQYQSYPSQYQLPQYQSPSMAQAQAIQNLSKSNGMPETIKRALMLVGEIHHLPGDEIHMRQLGVDLIFQNGAEALNLILQKQPRVEFGDMGESKAHAQWIKAENLIMINQKYKGDASRDTLYAISEAIYHEAGHVARLGDDQASIQEETNCLALNTLAHRFHSAMDPSYGQNNSDSRLITDGVALYPKLFFDPDPRKQGLVNRIIEKYGMLPPESPDHKIPRTPYGTSLVDGILRQIHHTNTTQWVA